VSAPASSAEDAAQTKADSEHEQVRREKLERIRSSGVDAYPPAPRRTTTISQLRQEFGDLAAETSTGKSVSIAGRVILNRPTGKLVFANLVESGAEVQVMLTAATTGEDAIANWKSFIDLGDHVWVEGEVIATKTGELTVKADQWALTSKAIRPLPDKHKGLVDPEARVRYRYLDLLVRDEAREMLVFRSTAVAALREFLQSRGFLEVETPMLQPIHGGALARPFVTHMNAYDMALYLRIAPELYLKRLLVGGVEKVFEINRNFRNEGADSSHNPEFTMLEMYESYGDYHTMREITREMIQFVATRVFGKQVLRRAEPDGTQLEVDISGEWPVVSVYQKLSEVLGGDISPLSPVAQLRDLATKAGVTLAEGASASAIVIELYEQLLERTTTSPVFFADFPVESSPLTRAHRSIAGVAERWDLVSFGAEVATGYTELNDPIEQRRRFVEQAQLRASGDDEAMVVDDDFLRAIEHGMPPAGGQGMGVDRLLMMLTGKGIRDTVAFPLVKPST
jgi:lysyl-tRNA synthetase class 2